MAAMSPGDWLELADRLDRAGGLMDCAHLPGNDFADWPQEKREQLSANLKKMAADIREHRIPPSLVTPLGR